MALPEPIKVAFHRRGRLGAPGQGALGGQLAQLGEHPVAGRAAGDVAGVEVAGVLAADGDQATLTVLKISRQTAYRFGDLRAAVPRRARTGPDQPAVGTWEDRAPFTLAQARAFVAEPMARLRAAQEGDRNNALNAAAMALGHFIDSGFWSYEDAEETLIQACDAIGYAREDPGGMHRTITSGLAAGMAQSAQRTEGDKGTAHPGAPPTAEEIRARSDNFDERFGVKYFGNLDRKTIILVKTLAEDIIAVGPLASGIDDRMWAYSDGVWRPAPNIVRDRSTRLLGERFHTTHATNAEAIIGANVPKISCKPVDRYINFRNGLLEWRTGELVPHDSDVLSTLQLPIAWNPHAQCPAFDEFLSQVVPEDTIPLMWELIGYMMYDGNPLHKAAMLHGSGRNGKGTFLRVLKALLGEENVTAVTLQALASERFAPAGLFGKLANIAGDIDGTFIENTARFKAITGGDVISAEFKFRDQFEFTPRAVPIFSANKIPGSADVTVGYLSRWVVLPFPNTFTGKEDRGLDARLSTPAELAGIARKGVKALWDLMARGNFIETESSQKAFDDFRRKVNQVESWLHECCERSPEHGHIKRTELFAAYQRWAEQDGFGKLKAREFYDRLVAAGITAAKVHGSRGFTGIKVIDQCFGGPSSAWGTP